MVNVGVSITCYVRDSVLLGPVAACSRCMAEGESDAVSGQETKTGMIVCTGGCRFGGWSRSVER